MASSSNDDPISILNPAKNAAKVFSQTLEVSTTRIKALNDAVSKTLPSILTSSVVSSPLHVNTFNTVLAKYERIPGEVETELEQLTTILRNASTAYDSAKNEYRDKLSALQEKEDNFEVERQNASESFATIRDDLVKLQEATEAAKSAAISSKQTFENAVKILEDATAQFALTEAAHKTALMETKLELSEKSNEVDRLKLQSTSTNLEALELARRNGYEAGSRRAEEKGKEELRGVEARHLRELTQKEKDLNRAQDLKEEKGNNLAAANSNVMRLEKELDALKQTYANAEKTRVETISTAKREAAIEYEKGLRQMKQDHDERMEIYGEVLRAEMNKLDELSGTLQSNISSQAQSNHDNIKQLLETQASGHMNGLRTQASETIRMMGDNITKLAERQRILDERDEAHEALNKDLRSSYLRGTILADELGKEGQIFQAFHSLSQDFKKATDTISRDVADAIKNNETLSVKVVNQESTIKKLEHEAQELTKDNQSLREKSDKSAAQILALRESESELHNRLDELRTTTQQNENERVRTISANFVLLEEHEKLESAYNKLLDKDEDKQLKINDLTYSNAQLSERDAKLLERAKRYEIQLDDLKKDIVLQKDKALEKEKELVRLKTECDKLKRQQTSWEEQRTEMLGEATRKRGEFTRSESKVVELRATIDDLRQDVEKRQAKNAQLTTEGINLKTQLSTVKDELEEKTTSAGHQESRINQLQKTIDQGEEKIRKLNADINRLTRQSDAFQRRAENCENDRSRLTQQSQYNIEISSTSGPSTSATISRGRPSRPVQSSTQFTSASASLPILTTTESTQDTQSSPADHALSTIETTGPTQPSLTGQIRSTQRDRPSVRFESEVTTTPASTSISGRGLSSPAPEPHAKRRDTGASKSSQQLASAGRMSQVPEDSEADSSAYDSGPSRVTPTPAPRRGLTSTRSMPNLAGQLRFGGDDDEDEDEERTPQQPGHRSQLRSTGGDDGDEDEARTPQQSSRRSQQPQQQQQASTSRLRRSQPGLQPYPLRTRASQSRLQATAPTTPQSRSGSGYGSLGRPSGGRMPLAPTTTFSQQRRATPSATTISTQQRRATPSRQITSQTESTDTTGNTTVEETPQATHHSIWASNLSSDLQASSERQSFERLFAATRFAPEEDVDDVLTIFNRLAGESLQADIPGIVETLDRESRRPSPGCMTATLAKQQRSNIYFDDDDQEHRRPCNYCQATNKLCWGVSIVPDIGKGDNNDEGDDKAYIKHRGSRSSRAAEANNALSFRTKGGKRWDCYCRKPLDKPSGPGRPDDDGTGGGNQIGMAI